jgi:Rps23 Pro-64 3,4-dihydroxylase Tpa1-like proline 4-hydroxylase|tara:strand:- start:379 stop:1218 length:840 start_codon:yes stop_codon:yes gene_type:complete
MNYKEILSENFLNLDRIAQQNQNIYKNAKPFPSIVLDDFFNKTFLTKVNEEFPDLSTSEDTKKYKNINEVKFTNNKYETFKDNTRFCFDFLNSKLFLNFLQKITSTEEILISDPYLKGGGLHQIKKGGLLKIHTDFNKHGLFDLDRRINVLVYLNKNWQENYGGHLELWDLDMKNAVKKILPIFNRMVIFSTTDYSNHGHPEQLKCPDNVSRKSFALYYYSSGRPKSEIHISNQKLGTMFKNRKGLKNDVFINHSRFKHFLMKFRFYKFLRDIRDKYFK